MDYKKALSKPALEQPKCLKTKKEEFIVEVSNEENYILNLKDSILTEVSLHIESLCKNFIENDLILDQPLLMMHHTGYKNFTNEILNIFQNNLEIIVEEKEETDTELDDDEFDLLELDFKNYN